MEEYEDHAGAEDLPYTPLELLGRLEVELSVRLGALQGDVGFILAIMQRAAKINDSKYFNGPSFEYHCNLIGLDYETLKIMLGKMGLIKENIKNKLMKYEQEIVDKYLFENKSKKKIASEYSTTYYYVEEILRDFKKVRIGFHHPDSKYTSADVKKDRVAGMTYRELIKKYKISSKDVKKAIEAP